MTKQTDYRALRLAAGLGIRTVGLRAGINTGRLSIIERGVTPTADERRRIQLALAEERVVQENTARKETTE